LIITTKYKLRKPEDSDFIEVDDLNYNTDKIEAELMRIDAASENLEQGTVSVKIATFPVSSWSSDAPYTATIPVEGIKATDRPVVGLYISGAEGATGVKAMGKAYSCMDRIKTLDGQIRAYCYNKKPTSDFSVQLKGR